MFTRGRPANVTSGEHQQGYSVLEVLVVITIVGILLSLLVVAVQQARETARRSQCGANIRQIALAVAQYESMSRAFPLGFSGGCNFLAYVLPYMEQEKLYWAVRSMDPMATTEGIQEGLALHVCPSDSGIRRLPGAVAGANYVGNSGLWTVMTGFDGMFRYDDDVGTGYGVGPVFAADVTDGLSNTALISESLRANGRPDRLRTVWNMPMAYEEPTELDAFVAACGAIPMEPSNAGWLGHSLIRGTPWFDGNLVVTLYNHAMPPNSPSCFNKNSGLSALASVSSHHGVIMMAYADAHTTAISPEIDLIVWRSFGSRADGLSQ